MDSFAFIRGGHVSLNSIPLNLQSQWGPADSRVDGHMGGWHWAGVAQHPQQVVFIELDAKLQIQLYSGVIQTSAWMPKREIKIQVVWKSETSGKLADTVKDVLLAHVTWNGRVSGMACYCLKAGVLLLSTNAAWALASAPWSVWAGRFIWPSARQQSRDWFRGQADASLCRHTSVSAGATEKSDTTWLETGLRGVGQGGRHLFP